MYGCLVRMTFIFRVYVRISLQRRPCRNESRPKTSRCQFIILLLFVFCADVRKQLPNKIEWAMPRSKCNIHEVAGAVPETREKTHQECLLLRPMVRTKPPATASWLCRAIACMLGWLLAPSGSSLPRARLHCGPPDADSSWRCGVPERFFFRKSGSALGP